METVGRFAPSPSGRLHLGNLLCALLVWLSARQKDGRVLLRVEDLDTARCPRRYSEQMERDLQWLGLDWDIGPGRDNGTGPYYQSQRTEIYQAALETLRERYAAELEPAPLPEEPSEPAAEPDPQEPEIPAEIPEVPEEYRGTVTELTMTGEDSPAYVRWDNIWIRNYTKLTAAEVQKVLATPNRVTLNPKEKGPQLLLFHTHATESYELYDSPYFDTRNTWRDTDNQNNMVAVGDVLASGLEQAGLAVLHDATQHDNPAYTGAYIRSTETIKSYQKNYPGLRVLLDIHRDAILYSDTSIAKTAAVINGKKAAQLMIIAPYDDGTLDLPNWRENFRFAAALAAAIEEKYPGLCRPIFFCSRSYNYACSDGALLLEFGTNGNTMEEAQYTAELIAPVIAEVISGRAE